MFSKRSGIAKQVQNDKQRSVSYMKKISLKVFCSIVSISCFLSAGATIQAMRAGTADSQDSSPKFERQTRSGVQLKRKAEDAASPIVSSQDLDAQTVEQLAALYRLTHPEQFVRDTRTAAVEPKKYRKAARAMKKAAAETFGPAYVEARLEEPYAEVVAEQQIAISRPLTKDRQTRRQIARVLNTFEKVRDSLSQDIRDNAAQARIPFQKVKESARRSTSLTKLIEAEPTQTPPGSQTSGSTTQSMGSQDTWIIDPQA